MQKRRRSTKPSLLTLGLSELLGTGLLLFLGCMGCIGAIDSMPLPHHASSLSFGLVIMLIIQVRNKKNKYGVRISIFFLQMFGHISGAHLNPGVTMATVFLGILKPLTAVIYIVAQFVGAILGFALLKVITDIII